MRHILAVYTEWWGQRRYFHPQLSSITPVSPKLQITAPSAWTSLVECGRYTRCLRTQRQGWGLGHLFGLASSPASPPPPPPSSPFLPPTHHPPPPPYPLPNLPSRCNSTSSRLTQHPLLESNCYSVSPPARIMKLRPKRQRWERSHRKQGWRRTKSKYIGGAGDQKQS